MDAPLSLLAVIVVALPPTGFPSLLHLCSRQPSMRLTELPQLIRPDGLVACRYGQLDATRPHACKRLHHGAASPPFLSP